jgi:hemolysin III
MMKTYTPEEERLNILTHGFGLILSFVALFLLLIHGISYGSWTHGLSFGIYGTSLVLLYGASTLYHSATEPSRRFVLNIIDHAAIYILIAGTYTPFTLITLNNSVGWLIFGISWSMALLGVIIKLFYTGRFDLISTLMYVLMGWMIVFAINPLIKNLSIIGLYWLLAGGIAYTVGAIFYSLQSLKFNHAIFHVFVLIGSFCHFISVYFYV